jgi:hypothetical protein
MPLRSFQDREGHEWRVWSVVPQSSAASTLDEMFRDGWLCFERIDLGERCRLTLSEVPAGWDSLSDERLDLLRRVATAVTVASAEPEVGRPVTGKIPIENSARDRSTGPRTVIGGSEDADERP